MSFSFSISATDGEARCGRIETIRGPIDTPAFMPVGTAGTVKAILPDHVRATGADIVLGNTYHLMLRPTAERVAAAFKLVLSNESVEAILVNIFGGIVRCDLIAEGIVTAVKEVGVSVPVVVRLEGTLVDEGQKLLAESGLAIISASDLNDAAKKAVAAAKRASGGEA